MESRAKFEQIKKFEKDLKDCTQCGYCTFWCPLYNEEPVETSVARGKVATIRELVARNGDYDKGTEDQVNRCMLCMTCAEHCPSKVNATNLVLAARADKVKAKGIHFPYNIVYRWLLPRRELFGKVVKLASKFQWFFMPKTEGSIRHLAFFLSAMGKGRKIPQLAPVFFRQQASVVNKPPAGVKTKMRVGFFYGCATNFIFPQIGKKIVDFLTKNGVEVFIPGEQNCCGTPIFMGAGDFETGRRIADANVRAFQDVDYIVSGCATCTSGLKDYRKFLADTPEREKSYEAFGQKIKDISEFLVDILKLSPSAYKITPALKGKKITWHDSCHLNRYLHVKDQPRRILQSLEGAEYKEMVRADWCCGMAGSFSMYYYDLSKKIADRKVETIKETKADIVAAGCPGCMIQLIDSTMRHNVPVKVMHIMELFE
ncbi:MAG: Lactate utilization protein A [Syntrophorhabdus sp. PtaU1.Bin050]|nr:MAG: Lactate utilization protein A [Syntrophorhabdus sp. PtaU1.Bin050]